MWPTKLLNCNRPIYYDILSIVEVKVSSLLVPFLWGNYTIPEIEVYKETHERRTPESQDQPLINLPS